jgi:hypothetical protein
MSVPITFVERIKNGADRDDTDRLLRKDLPAGAVSWSVDLDGRIAILNFVCPCGCGVVGSLPVRAGFGQADKHWTWDGRRDKPTLTPSIERTSPCKWRGYLTSGEFLAIN